MKNLNNFLQRRKLQKWILLKRWISSSRTILEDGGTDRLNNVNALVDIGITIILVRSKIVVSNNVILHCSTFNLIRNQYYIK